MRILIDMQGTQTESAYRGIGRYIISLVKALIRINSKHEIVLMLNSSFTDSIDSIRSTFDGLLPQDKLRICYTTNRVSQSHPKNMKRRKVAEQVRHAFIESLCPDILLIASHFEGFIDDAVTNINSAQNSYKTIVIIYDLIPLIFSEQYLKSNPKYEAYYKEKLDELIKADAWLTISDHSKNDICNLLNLNAGLVTNISAACDPVFKPSVFSRKEMLEFQSDLGIKRQFILYSGGVDLRKNLSSLIRVFLTLPFEIKLRHQLVITGEISKDIIENFRAGIQSLNESSDEVIFVGHVSDTQLRNLYSSCKLYICPSLYEGFGLPILEAMSCDAPVIASRVSSLPEIISYDDAMFDPSSEDEILSKLTQVLTDNAFRKSLIKNGRTQIKRFSWDSVAVKALKAIEKIKYPPQQQIKNFSEFQQKNVQKLIDDLLISSSKFEDEDHKDLAACIALNHPTRSSKKIFVDISELVKRDAATGVQRVTRNTLYQLFLQPPEGFEVEAVYASVAKTADDLGYRKATKFTAKMLNLTENESDELIEPIPGDIFLGLDLQHHTTRTQAEYLKLLKDFGVLVYFVVYDLLPIHFPEYWPYEHSVNEVHGEWLHTIIKFDGLICISRSVADELIDWIELNSPKRPRSLNIGWFHLGADMDKVHKNTDTKEDVALKFGKRITFLMVGTIEPRKRYDQVFEAFDLLWKEGVEVNLVIVGKQGWLVNDLVKKMNSHAKKNINFFWFEGATDIVLDKIYQEADSLIASSAGEGFGLPLIEAAHYNLPIIARNIPVFKEVAGDNAFYFEGNKGNDLYLALKKWINDYKLNQHPKSNIKFLTWRESAQHLKEVIIDNNWYKRLN